MQSLEAETLPGILADFREQSQHIQDLLYRLSFQQGTARLYKLIKPSEEEIRELAEERQALQKQLINLQSLNLNIGQQQLETQAKVELEATLTIQRKQLALAEQSASTLLSYLQGNLILANKQADTLIAQLQAENLPHLEANILLNRAYNLKAKIAASLENFNDATNLYKEALRVLPEDVMTWSNFGGLLTDRGLALEAYPYYQKLSPRLGQITPLQRPIVNSGMAYGLLMLAQAIEQKAITETKNIPSVLALRSQARNLLKEAVNLDPRYINTRIFQALLSHDEGNYEKGLQEINEALSLQDQYPTALRRKGLILAKLGDTEAALSSLSQARDIFMVEKDRNASWIKRVEKDISDIEARMAQRNRM